MRKRENTKKWSFLSFNTRDWKGFTFRSGPAKKTTKQKRRLTNTGLVDKSDLKNVKQQSSMHRRRC